MIGAKDFVAGPDYGGGDDGDDDSLLTRQQPQRVFLLNDPFQCRLQKACHLMVSSQHWTQPMMMLELCPSHKNFPGAFAVSTPRDPR